MGDENMENSNQDLVSAVVNNDVLPVEKAKRSLGWKITTGALGIAVLGLAGFLAYHFVMIDHNDKRCEEKTCEVVEANDEEAGVTNVLDDVPQNLTIKGHRSLNGGELGGLSLNASVFPNLQQGGVRVAGPYNGGKWTVSVDWDSVKQAFGLENSRTGVEWKQDVDLNLGGEVIDVFATGFGQAVGDETLFFLMKDGTIEYIPVRKALETNVFKSYGKLPGVEHVVKMVNATGVGFGAGKSAAAIRADGDYYDLYNAIKATGNY